MHPLISSALSSAVVDRRGGHRRKVLEMFRQHIERDRMPRDVLDRYRTQQLTPLLVFLRDYLPRYRDFVPSDMEKRASDALQVLKQIPPMSRADIQQSPSSFMIASPAESFDDFTGGSTGTPMSFKIDRPTQRAREASLYWANSLAGWQPGEKIAMLWGSDRDATAAKRDMRLELRWLLDNMRWFNAFNMGEDEMHTFHVHMNKFNPHLIVAYAGSIHSYASFLKAAGIKPAYPIKGIVSSAEVLTEPMRSTVEAVFGKPVFDRYGNREAGAIAAECSAHNGLHVLEGDFFVEVDSEDPSSVPGPILITYYHNHVMPLIRYDTGDLGLLQSGTCSCGRQTARLARIVGRQSDTIRTANGRLIHGEYFTHVLYGADGVKEFRFIQEELNRYRLLVVADKKSQMEEVWRKKIMDMLAPGDEFIIEYVTDIPPLASGKRRFTLSNLKNQKS